MKSKQILIHSLDPYTDIFWNGLFIRNNHNISHLYLYLRCRHWPTFSYYQHHFTIIFRAWPEPSLWIINISRLTYTVRQSVLSAKPHHIATFNFLLISSVLAVARIVILSLLVLLGAYSTFHLLRSSGQDDQPNIKWSNRRIKHYISLYTIHDMYFIFITFNVALKWSGHWPGLLCAVSVRQTISSDALRNIWFGS